MTVITLTKANFKEVIESNHFVIIDVYKRQGVSCNRM